MKPTDETRADAAHRIGYDMDNIAPGLFQGGRPPSGEKFATLGFDVLVLCAEEHQPNAKDFYKFELVGNQLLRTPTKVLHCPMRDSGLTLRHGDWELANLCAREVAQHLANGDSVLVTCWSGINRSGLVDALALWHMAAISGKEAIEQVRQGRPGSFRNPHFIRAVEELP